MSDSNTRSPGPGPICDATSGLMVGLALGVALGRLTGNLAAGIGTGIAIGGASAISRKRGSSRWALWLGLYAAVVLVAFVLKFLSVLK